MPPIKLLIRFYTTYKCTFALFVTYFQGIERTIQKISYWSQFNMIFWDIQNFKSVHSLYLSVKQTTENVDVGGSVPNHSALVPIMCNLYQFF